MTQKRRYKSSEPAPETVIAEVIVKGLWYLVKLPFKLIAKKAGVGKVATNRGAVPPSLAVQLAGHWPSEASAHAVTEADKLLDAALQAAGVPGETMGERLKASSHLFTANLYEEIWQAHKLRNTLAHEVGVHAHDSEILQALNTFRQALRDLGLPL